MTKVLNRYSSMNCDHFFCRHAVSLNRILFLVLILSNYDLTFQSVSLRWLPAPSRSQLAVLLGTPVLR